MPRYEQAFSKFRRIEAWSMRDLGFSFVEIGEELHCTSKAATQLAHKAIKRNEVPPSEEYCDNINPRFIKTLSVIL